MGLIMNYLTAGKRHRQERWEYEDTHICYQAYCRICGETSYGKARTPQDAIRRLQSSSSGCGRDMHDPQIQEV